MKYIFYIFIFLCLPAAAFANYPGKYAAVIMDFDTGRILHEVNATAPRYPASLTKMMTLYMTFDALASGRLSLNQTFVTSYHAASREPSKLGLRPGERVSVKTLILGLVTRSANDAATVLAEGLGQGSERRFCRMMTLRARQIGLRNSNFCNASGLPESCQITTAYDMAKLARAIIIDYPEYYHFFQTRQFVYHGAVCRTHNHMLGRYQGVDGLKTGYCRASGFNIATSMKRGNRRLIGVVMGLPSAHARDVHMAQLLYQSFRMYPSLGMTDDY